MDYVHLRSAGVNESEISLVDVRPTRVRWLIMAMLTFTVAVNTLGRLNFGVLGEYIQDELSFDTLNMGWISAAFSLAYHPFQVPREWAGGGCGPRKVLAFSILSGSAATAAM